MSKLRSVNTQFWSDPWIEDLSANEKLLYLYFITNEKTNMLGIYELSLKKISFETGINIDEIEKALKGFESIKKVKYLKNHVILLNFSKHQNYNTNMKKSAIDIYNKLPKYLKINEEEIEKNNISEGFERVRKALGMVRKIEVEDELELEYKLEVEGKEKIFDNKKNLEHLFSLKNESQTWIETVAMQQKISIDLICEKLDEFELFLRTIEKSHYNKSEFISHFINWLTKKNNSEKNGKQQSNASSGKKPYRFDLETAIAEQTSNSSP